MAVLAVTTFAPGPACRLGASLATPEARKTNSRVRGACSPGRAGPAASSGTLDGAPAQPLSWLAGGLIRRLRECSAGVEGEPTSTEAPARPEVDPECAGLATLRGSVSLRIGMAGVLASDWL